MRYNLKKGFTLIEVLIVIGMFIVLLSSYVVFSSSRYKKIMALKLLDALERTSVNFYLMNFRYPTYEELIDIFSQINNTFVRVINPYTGTTEGIIVENTPNNLRQTIIIMNPKKNEIISQVTLEPLLLRTDMITTSEDMDKYFKYYSIDFPFSY